MIKVQVELTALSRVELGSNDSLNKRLPTICLQVVSGLLSRRSVVRVHSGSPVSTLTNQALTPDLPSKWAVLSFRIYDTTRHHKTSKSVESRVEFLGSTSKGIIEFLSRTVRPLAEKSFQILLQNQSDSQSRNFSQSILAHGRAYLFKQPNEPGESNGNSSNSY